MSSQHIDNTLPCRLDTTAINYAAIHGIPLLSASSRDLRDVSERQSNGIVLSSPSTPERLDKRLAIQLHTHSLVPCRLAINSLTFGQETYFYCRSSQSSCKRRVILLIYISSDPRSPVSLSVLRITHKNTPDCQ
jgi:hypothetical protein